MTNQIIVPIDGSRHALRALGVAVDLARQRGLDILLLHVIPAGGVPEGLQQWAEIEHVHEMPQWLYDEGLAGNLLESARNTISADVGIEVSQQIEYGNVAQCITDQSMSARVEMIVMGSRGLSDFSGLVLGSVAHRVAHDARCSVVTVT